MYSLLIIFSCLIFCYCAFAEEFRGRHGALKGNNPVPVGEEVLEVAEELMDKVNLPMANVESPKFNVDLYGGNLDLTVAKIDLSNGKIDLTKTKLDLTGDKVNIPKRKEALSKCKEKIDSSSEFSKPSAFTYCFTVTFGTNSYEERQSNDFRFSVEFTEGWNRLLLHNYVEQFGDAFPWVNQSTEGCISWVSSRKEFHLYLGGKRVLGGIGNLEWDLLGKTENLKPEDKQARAAAEDRQIGLEQEKRQTRRTISGWMTALRRWNKALSKAEIQQVTDGILKGVKIDGIFPNWKLTAIQIAEAFQPPPVRIEESPSTTEMTTEIPTTAEITTETMTMETITEMTTTETTTLATTEMTTTLPEITTPVSCDIPTTSMFDNDPSMATVTYQNQKEFEGFIEIPKVELKNFTLCTWFYYDDKYREQYGHSDKIKHLIDYTDMTGTFMKIGKNSRDGILVEMYSDIFKKLKFEDYKWNHICVEKATINNGSIFIFGNGKLLKHATGILNEDTVFYSGKIIFSQFNYKAVNPNDSLREYEYKTSGINLWDHLLTAEEVQKEYNCSGSMAGNVVNWKTATLKNISEMTSDTDEALTGVEVTKQIKCLHPTTSSLDSDSRLANAKFSTPKHISGFMEIPKDEPMNIATLCAWIYYESESKAIAKNGISIEPMITYQMGNEKLVIDKKDRDITVQFNNKKLKVNKFTGYSCQHICVVKKSSFIYVYANGILATEKNSERQLETPSERQISNFVAFSQLNYRPFEKLRPTRGYEWKVTGINLWDYALDDKEVLKAYNCFGSMPGDVIAWNNATILINEQH